MTNGDKIRNMTDEELENLLNKAVFCGGLVRSEQSSAECKGCSYPFCSPERYAEWIAEALNCWYTVTDKYLQLSPPMLQVMRWAYESGVTAEKWVDEQEVE